MTSIYKIAEQVCLVTGRMGDIQAITSFVIDAYSSCAKLSWYENKQDGSNSVDGAFIYTFGKTESLTPILDLDTDIYFIILPSSFLRLPHEMGINQVSFMKGQNKSFIRIGVGSIGLWANLKASLFGGNQTYFVEGGRIYFPRMTSLDTGNILLKMAIALDNVDIDEELDIPRSMVDMIVNIVVTKLQQKPAGEDKVLT